MIIIPLVKIFSKSESEGLNIRAFLANSFSVRKIFIQQYEYYMEQLDLTKLPEEEKKQLWEDSKICDDRLGWCKAVRFYESCL